MGALDDLLATLPPGRGPSNLDAQGQRMSPLLETHYMDAVERFSNKHSGAKAHWHAMGEYLQAHPKKGEKTPAALSRAYQAVTKKSEKSDAAEVLLAHLRGAKNAKTSEATWKEDLNDAWGH